MFIDGRAPILFRQTCETPTVSQHNVGSQANFVMHSSTVLNKSSIDKNPTSQEWGISNSSKQYPDEKQFCNWGRDCQHYVLQLYLHSERRTSQLHWYKISYFCCSSLKGQLWCTKWRQFTCSIFRLDATQLVYYEANARIGHRTEIGEYFVTPFCIKFTSLCILLLLWPSD